MVTTFNETDHPRGAGGRFTQKAAAEPQVDIGTPDPPPAPMSFTAAHGVSFNVRYVPAGGAYGRTGSLVADEDMVEFYDARHGESDGLGQFVSRYYAQTLRERDEGVGLTLDGGTRDWRVDAESMRQVTQWMDGPGSVDDAAVASARSRNVPVDSFGGVMNGDWYGESSVVADALNERYRAAGEPTIHMEDNGEDDWGGGEASVSMRVVSPAGATVAVQQMDWKDLADDDPDTVGEDAFRQYARALHSEREYLLGRARS